jgi:hypothetical protein
MRRVAFRFAGGRAVAAGGAIGSGVAEDVASSTSRVPHCLHILAALRFGVWQWGQRMFESL